jgi:ADP-heptose:LPS heptosyltransferase
MTNLLIRQPKRILIIRLSSLGDITQCIPVSYNLRKKFNQAHITWLVREKYAKLLEMDASLDEIIEIKNADLRTIFGRITEIIRIIKIIRSKKFEIVLDLHCALITNIISIFSNAAIKLGIDKRNDLGFKMLKHFPLRNNKIHRIDAYLSVLKLLGLGNCEIKYSFKIPPETKDQALGLLKKYNYTPKETIIALHPGTRCKIKQWEIEKFAEIASRLIIEHSAKILVIYGPEERYLEQNDAIKLFNPDLRFAACSDIKQLTAILESCDLLIGNDSGPIHLAAALKIPTVSIFGPSNHLVSSPWGEKHKVVRKDLPCSPCYGRFSVRFKCKNKNRQECLKSISVEDVLNAVEPIIKEITDAKQKKAAGK